MTPVRGEGYRTGKREKLGDNKIAPEPSVVPSRSSGEGWPFRVVPLWDKGASPLSCPSPLWRDTGYGRECGLGTGTLRLRAVPRSGLNEEPSAAMTPSSWGNGSLGPKAGGGSGQSSPNSLLGTLCSTIPGNSQGLLQNEAWWPGKGRKQEGVKLRSYPEWHLWCSQPTMSPRGLQENPTDFSSVRGLTNVLHVLFIWIQPDSSAALIAVDMM